MSPEQWKKVKAIVQEALDCSPPERTSYLDAACGSDASLRREIESLLDFNKSGLLDKPAAEVLADIEETIERNSARENVPSDAEADPRSDSRFDSGEVLAGRYRIVAWLGKGGMGEVYRAHDLKLDQDVALKFLPAGFQKDPSRRERFHREVRTARQVSHPNVCRVYDLGEVDGHIFLTMEYIDGEDLGSLLRRIGRLPPDKAVEIAQQLCFGLAAAHDKGVLHRDLKPANVMIDGQGVARITDFGLAAAANEIEGAEIRAGTPAFMSPEQSSGKEVTVQSDLYSLGLVLYELFTGKRAFPASTPEELVRMRRDSTPTSPSSLVEGIDPAVERAIFRCLDVDPRGRPRSALAVAAALPGGDPLATAIAAGETPSPQLVAESGKGGALRPAYAWAALLGTFALLILLFPFLKSTNLNGLVALPRFPENLAERAREILLDLGYPEPPSDATHGFSLHPEYIHYLESKTSSHKFDALSARYQGAVTFWYRQSPDYLVPHRLTPTNFFARHYDPPVSEPGGILVRLDPQGRLRELIAIPDETTPPDETEVPSEPSWQRLFALAELDPQPFSPAEPEGVPPVVNDRRAAWEGTEPESGLPVRIEAAAFDGRPVYFQTHWPWTPDEVSSNPWPRPSDVIRGTWGGWVHFSARVLLLLVAALFARRNLRLKRGDRRGALRFALFMASLLMLHWIFGAHHVSGAAEVDLLFGALYVAAFTFVQIWIFYIALEPYMRKVWPQMMVSWMRLLEGRFRDPVVGRDILMGCLLGAVTPFMSTRLALLVEDWLGVEAVVFPQDMAVAQLDVLGGTSQAISEFFLIHLNTLTTVLYFFLVLFVLRLLTRRSWLAGSVFAILTTMVYASTVGPISMAATIVFQGLWVFFLFRFGWVTFIVTVLVADILKTFPLTLDPASWYSHLTLLSLLFVGGLTLWSFKVSLGDRPAFGDILADA